MRKSTTAAAGWEGAFALADVSGTDMLDRASLALVGRSLALRGEAVFLIRESGLVPCSDSCRHIRQISTRSSRPSPRSSTGCGTPRSGPFEDTWRQLGALVQTISADECHNYLVNADYASRKP